MAIGKGISREVVIGRETTYGTSAGAGVGRVLRRTNATLNLSKDGFDSQEILPSQQARDFRHGMRRPGGRISCQLSPGAYKEFFEGILRRDFANGATTGAQTTIAAAAGPPGTFTRSGGSYLTDGFKVGDVVRATGFTTTAVANNSRNYRIRDLTATVMTVSGTGDETVVTKAAGDSVTIAVVGKKTFIPQTGHSFPGHTIEDWQPDLDTAASERYIGCRFPTMDIRVPANGPVTIDTSILALDILDGTTRHFTAPAAMTTDNSLAGVSGLIRFNGADVALITSLEMRIACAAQQDPVVGSRVAPDIFLGMLGVQGRLSLYKRDSALRNAFRDESEVDLHLFLSSDGTVNGSFMAIGMQRIKLAGVDKADSDRAIMESVQFRSLDLVTGSGAGTKHEATTITVQDSSL